MTKEEIKTNLNEILNFIKFAGSRIPTEHWSWDNEKYDWIESLNEVIKIVEQEPKTGHWINGDDKCPCCGKSKFEGLDADIWADWQPKHCPNCGTKMVESQESEENNG